MVVLSFGLTLTFCCVDPTAVVRPAATTSAALLVFSPSTPMVFMEPSVTWHAQQQHSMFDA
jgi:hypothetical protein